jgi:hypothetical protein
MSIWMVMLAPIVVLKLEDLSLVLPACPQARALLMGLLMMQLNIVNALTMILLECQFVAHFLSLGLTAPNCLSSIC